METYVEVLVGEVEAHKNIPYGGHSCGILNQGKAAEWQHVVAAVSDVSVMERPVPEVKKKW